MPNNPFDTIRQQETPDSSFRWYQNAIRKVGLSSLQPQKALKSDIGELVTTMVTGNMYLFMYDPKMANTLPYYDTAPLILMFRKVPDGFFGLNLHYLPPMARMRLLDRLLQLSDDTSLTETTRLRLRWQLLDNTTRFPGVHACVKHYLYNHVTSRIMKIYPKDWRKTIMLPIDRFEKQDRTDVFNDSRSKM